MTCGIRKSRESSSTRGVRRKRPPAACRRGRCVRRLALEQLESRRVLSISGGVLTDDIYPAGDKDEQFFSISSQELSAVGGEYVVTLSLSGGVSGFQPRARLQAPSGSLIGSVIDAGSSQTFKLTLAGSYVVNVEATTTRTQEPTPWRWKGFGRQVWMPKPSRWEN